jgi:hypothetical protein
MMKNTKVDDIDIRKKRSDMYKNPTVPTIGMSSEVSNIVNIISIGPPEIYLTA